MSVTTVIIIIANSARMLAQQAYQRGKKSLVIDYFADIDTQSYALAYQQVPSLSYAALQPIISAWCQHYVIEGIIYGSGFEQHSSTLFALAKHVKLIGNTPETFTAVSDKASFFAQLSTLAIRYPPSQFIAPNDNDNRWLVKPLQGQGGVGIAYYADTGMLSEPVYWQRWQAGEAHSVLFLANGQQAQIVGFNRQWHSADSFLLAGLHNGSNLPTHQRSLLNDWLQRLVPCFQLRGLNSLDFIWDGEHCWLLEINPRPSASVQLYDGALWQRHIAASAGQLFTPLPPSPLRGYQLVYAPQDVLIPPLVWAEDYHDRPATGVLCRAGQPICSIMATQHSVLALQRHLYLRQQALLQQLYSA